MIFRSLQPNFHHHTEWYTPRKCGGIQIRICCKKKELLKLNAQCTGRDVRGAVRGVVKRKRNSERPRAETEWHSEHNQDHKYIHTDPSNFTLVTITTTRLYISSIHRMCTWRVKPCIRYGILWDLPICAPKHFHRATHLLPCCHKWPK